MQQRNLDIAPLLRRRRLVAGAWLLLVALAVPGLFRLEHESSVEGFFVPDAAAEARQRELRRYFVDDLAVRAVFEGPGIETAEGRRFLEDFERRATRLRGVMRAIGPRFDPSPSGERARADDFDRAAGLVGSATEGGIVTVVATLYDLPIEERRATLAEIEALFHDAPPGVDAALVGLPVLTRALDQALLRSLARIVPAVALVSALLLLVAFRDPRDALVPLVLVATLEAIVFGGMGHVGARLDFVLAVLAPILFVVALAMAVHLQTAYRRTRREHGAMIEDALVETWRAKATPVLWTGLSTAVGFGSLVTSPLPPVRTLGLWAAGGLVLTTAAMLFVQPAFVALLGSSAPPRDATRFEHASRRLGRDLAAWSVDHRRLVLVATAVVILPSLVGLGRLRAEHDLRSYFRPDNPARVAVETLQRRGVGAASVELMLYQPDGLDPSSVAAIADRLGKDPGVLGVLAAGDVDASRRSAEERERLRLAFATTDGERARLSVFLRLAPSAETAATLDRLDRQVRAAFAERAERAWTGRFLRLLDAQNHLFTTLVRSCATTLAVVAILFALLLGPSLAVRALVPNVLPGLVTLGALGWLGVPIDATTVMHVSIVLGLAVDDTLHTLAHFGAPGGPPRDRVIAALGATAGAHVATSALLALGFGALAFAEVVPVARFGAVTAASIGLVLVADLVLVPALLATTRSAATTSATQDEEAGTEQ